jgi:sugar (pentulose or hexulose) kinase
MLELVCVIDVGTTRTKVAMVDALGAVRAVASAPTPGAAAGDPDHALDIAALPGLLGTLVRTALAETGGSTVTGICVTGQRATFVAADSSGQPLAVLSWQDPRSAPDVEALRAEIDAATYQGITGLPLTTISVLARLRWLRRCRPELTPSTARISLVTEEVLRSLGAPDRVIDPSNAAPLGVWDLTRAAFSPELLRLAGLDAAMLPQVAAAGSPVGALATAAAAGCGLPSGTPLLLGGGDQACATLGMGVLDPGQVGLSLGTSADLTCPVDGVAEPRPGRICTPHVVPGQTLLEGFVSTFGAALDWGRALLRGSGPDPAAATGEPAADDPFFLPFLTGIATPDFAPGVRGGLVGLGPAHGPEVVARAVQEGLALELGRVLDSAALTGGLREIVACGGAAAAPSLLQRIADVTGRPVLARTDSEATLLGAACLAWAGLGRRPGPAAAARAFAQGRIRCFPPSARGDRSEQRRRDYDRWVVRLREAP